MTSTGSPLFDIPLIDLMDEVFRRFQNSSGYVPGRSLVLDQLHCRGCDTWWIDVNGTNDACACTCGPNDPHYKEWSSGSLVDRTDVDVWAEADRGGAS